MKWYNLLIIFFCIVLIFQVANLKFEKKSEGMILSDAKGNPPVPCMSVQMDRNLDQHFVDSCTAYDQICGDTATLNVVINLPEGQEDSYMDSYTRAVTIKSSDCGKLLYN